MVKLSTTEGILKQLKEKCNGRVYSKIKKEQEDLGGEQGLVGIGITSQ